MEVCCMGTICRICLGQGANLIRVWMIDGDKREYIYPYLYKLDVACIPHHLHVHLKLNERREPDYIKRKRANKFYRYMRNVNHCVTKTLVEYIKESEPDCTEVRIQNPETWSNAIYEEWGIWNYSQFVYQLKYKLEKATGIELKIIDNDEDGLGL